MTSGVTKTASDDVVDGASAHLTVEAGEEIIVDDSPVDGGIGGGTGKGLVMSDPIFVDNLSSFIYCGLGDAAMGSHFYSWQS